MPAWSATYEFVNQAAKVQYGIDVSKPPFSTCTQSDGTAYRAVDALYDYLRRTERAGWACPDTHRLRFNSFDADHGRVSTDAFVT